MYATFVWWDCNLLWHFAFSIYKAIKDIPDYMFRTNAIKWPNSFLIDFIIHDVNQNLCQTSIFLSTVHCPAMKKYRMLRHFHLKTPVPRQMEISHQCVHLRQILTCHTSFCSQIPQLKASLFNHHFSYWPSMSPITVFFSANVGSKMAARRWCLVDFSFVCLSSFGGGLQLSFEHSFFIS